MANIIEIKDLCYSMENKKIFDNLSLNIKKGSFVTITGPTGCGKSLLARIIVGHVNSKSYIKIDNEFINPKNIKNIRSKIGYAFENVDSTFVCNTVKENILFILKSKGIEGNKKIDSLLKDIDITHLLARNPKFLSQGEKQLVSIFTIILLEPKIIVLDESLSIIDDYTKEKIFKVLKKLNSAGSTIINFTQDSECILYGNELVIINNKKVMLHEKIEEAFSDVKKFTDNEIALPFMVDLSIKLQYYQKINKIYTDYKKLVNELWQ